MCLKYKKSYVKQQILKKMGQDSIMDLCKILLVIDYLLITFSTLFWKWNENEPANDHGMWVSVSALMENTLSCNVEPKGTNVT